MVCEFGCVEVVPAGGVLAFARDWNWKRKEAYYSFVPRGEGSRWFGLGGNREAIVLWS